MWPFRTVSTADRQRARVDATLLIAEHGHAAYSIARQHARAQDAGRLIDQSPDHCHRVRHEVRRLMGRA